MERPGDEIGRKHGRISLRRSKRRLAVDKDWRGLLEMPIVEATVTPRCQHDCYAITLSSPSVWRMPAAGQVPVVVDENSMLVMHMQCTATGIEDHCHCHPDD